MRLQNTIHYLETALQELKKMEELRDSGEKDEGEEKRDRNYVLEDGRFMNIAENEEDLERKKELEEVEDTKEIWNAGYKAGFQQGREEGEVRGYEEGKTDVADYLEAELDKRQASAIRLDQDEIERIRNL